MKLIVIRLHPINSLSLEIFMKTLICKNCGFTFLKESIWSKLAASIFPIDVIVMFLIVLDDFGTGHWVGGLIWTLLMAGQIHGKIKRNRLTKDKEVVCGRECPSCGDRAVAIESPLGQQLMGHWATPQGKADGLEEKPREVAADEQVSDEGANEEQMTDATTTAKLLEA